MKRLIFGAEVEYRNLIRFECVNRMSFQCAFVLKTLNDND